MMSKRKQLILILVLAAAVLLPCAHAQVSDPAAASILDKMPVPDAKQEQALNADLVKAGPGSVKQICDLIVPPGTGDDTKVLLLSRKWWPVCWQRRWHKLRMRR